MVKSTPRHVCQSCGAAHPRWVGRCEACGAWNSVVEEAAAPGGSAARRRGRGLAFSDLSGAAGAPPRLSTGNAEFDRVTGGGLVPGAAILIGGDPGIGKSTLLLQVAAALSARMPCAYISGEEAEDQIRLRAARLGVADSPVRLAAATDMGSILDTLDQPAPKGKSTGGEPATDASVGGESAGGPPRLAVIDSIQTMHLDTLDAAPGTVAQVRACAQALVRVAKRRGIVTLIAGHVTKDGAIAGPRVMEHMVDAVLYFEGERGHPFRILRAVKNRFGPASEIGVFDMTARGLAQVPNPSALFLGDRREGVPGAVVFAGMEGTRPVLVEIQALVTQAPPGSPRRTVVGWDAGRLAMVLAVLEARGGHSFAGRDVYLSVAGGLRVTEPAADLAVAAALVSALTGAPAPPDMVAFGEVALSGGVRPVSRMDSRLAEAAKLGFTAALTPRPRRGEDAPEGMRRAALDTLKNLEGWFDA